MNPTGMIDNREQGAVMARQIMGGQRELVAPPNQPRNIEIQDLSSGTNITSPHFDDPHIQATSSQRNLKKSMID
jgi:hypothetical protein